MRSRYFQKCDLFNTIVRAKEWGEESGPLNQEGQLSMTSYFERYLKISVSLLGINQLMLANRAGALTIMSPGD
jgi:hypothetical protein